MRKIIGVKEVAFGQELSSTPKLVVSRNLLSIRIVLSCFYLLIFYFEKFSAWIWRLPFAVYVKLQLSNNSLFEWFKEAISPSGHKLANASLVLRPSWASQAFLPLKSRAKERLRRKLRTRRFTNLIWLFSVNLGSAFFFSGRFTFTGKPRSDSENL